MEPASYRTNISDLLTDRPDVSNDELEVFVKFNMPPKTYSLVQVKSTTYNFAGLTSTTKVRLIALLPFGNEFSSFLAGVRKIFKGIKFKDDRTYCGGQLAKYILGIGEPSAQAQSDLEAAYNDRRRIFVYISNDGTEFECQLEQPQRGLFGRF